MRASVGKRLAALEAKLQSARAGGNLNAEINVMSADERGRLRDFLLFLKGGGQPGDAAFEKLKSLAEAAVYNARARLGLKL